VFNTEKRLRIDKENGITRHHLKVMLKGPLIVSENHQLESFLELRYNDLFLLSSCAADQI